MAVIGASERFSRVTVTSGGVDSLVMLFSDEIISWIRFSSPKLAETAAKDVKGTAAVKRCGNLKAQRTGLRAVAPSPIFPLKFLPSVPINP